MAAYLIVDTEITDPEAYEAYKLLAKPIVERFGGIYRARGGAMDVVDEERWRPVRLVIIEFASMAQARAFLDSEEYAPVKQMRYANAKCSSVIVDGL